ncbi:MAG: sugar ABC transporter ATP-binding protein [Deltaproteobacteria bacterium]|nr:sugar ABC transporter ATP-binding protein [Deltaproteobacteria bacterium]
MAPLVLLKKITKIFNGDHALDQVDFSLESNEIVGLLGDNGAGKTTLVKVLAGVHPPDSGELIIKGRKIDFRDYSVRKARDLGVETVHQDRCLGDKQPLWRNIFVGRHLTSRLGFIKIRQEKEETMRILTEHLSLSGLGVHPDSPAEILSGGEKQGLAIGRAMYFFSDVIILDEPTTALSVKEVDKVLNFIRKIKEHGKSCLYISHNLHHLYSVCDRFVVLHHGRVAAHFNKTTTSLDDLAAALFSVANGSPII